MFLLKKLDLNSRFLKKVKKNFELLWYQQVCCNMRGVRVEEGGSGVVGKLQYRKRWNGHISGWYRNSHDLNFFQLNPKHFNSSKKYSHFSLSQLFFHNYSFHFGLVVSDLVLINLLYLVYLLGEDILDGETGISGLFLEGARWDHEV